MISFILIKSYGVVELVKCGVVNLAKSVAKVVRIVALLILLIGWWE